MCEDHPDYVGQCPDWANVDQYCDHSTYGEWMKENCPESCGICDQAT